MSYARFVTAVFVMIALSPSWATAAPAKVTLISNARVHTVDGEIIEGGDVLFDDSGKILNVGASIEARAEERVDGTDLVLTPGLVEFVSQLGMVEVSAVAASSDADPGGDMVRAAFRAVDAFNPSSLVIPVQRAGGITSAVIVPAGGLVKGQSAWVNLDAPRFFGAVVRSPIAMHVALGEEGSGLTGGSRGSTSLALRELYDDARFYAKKKADHDRNQSRRLSASRLDLEALAQTFDGKMPVAFTAHRSSDILFMLDLCKELRLKPILVGGEEAWMVADELARQKVPVVVNPMANLPRSFARLGAREDNAAILYAAGVPLILSTFSSHNLRNLRQQAGNAVRGGLSHGAALRAVTLTPAEVAGVAALYGSITKGKRANLVLWSGDPFELSTRVEAMFIEGRRVSLDNRQRRLMERYKTLLRRSRPAAFDPVDLAK